MDRNKLLEELITPLANGTVIEEDKLAFIRQSIAKSSTQLLGRMM
jgi:hypothetical protein